MTTESFTIGDKNLSVRMDGPSANASLSQLAELWEMNDSATVRDCLKLQALEHNLDGADDARDALENLCEHWGVTQGKAVREALRYTAMSYKTEAEE